MVEGIIGPGVKPSFIKFSRNFSAFNCRTLSDKADIVEHDIFAEN